MAKLKNVTITRAFSESDICKKEFFKEPDGMIDIVLRDVITNKSENDNNPKSNVRYKNNILSKFFMLLCVMLGAMVCTLLTLVIVNNSSFLTHYNSTEYNSKLIYTANSSNFNTSKDLNYLIRSKRKINTDVATFQQGITPDSTLSANDNTTKFEGQSSVRQLYTIKPPVQPLNISSRMKSKSNMLMNISAVPKCPTYISPLGYPILQEPALPFVYNSKAVASHTNLITHSREDHHHETFQNQLISSINGQLSVCQPTRKLADDIVENSESLVENPNLQLPLLQTSKNSTRASRNCPYGEVSCEDDSKCIKVRQRCDGEVHCKDASDEAFCPCKTRIIKSRLCDGYIDCPNGEDELKCFGCEPGTFSCDDWSPIERISTCIPSEERCDGIAQCPTEKDELDCALLSDNISTKQRFMTSKAAGFLYKNFKGRWYPACQNTELWANEACRFEIGASTVAPLTNLVPLDVNYRGSYASASALGEVEIVQSCEDSVAVFVECPPLVCGLRLKEMNPFRREEVDTSAERILGQIHTSIPLFQIHHNGSDPILGNSRVVGGNPSQPKAWPWIVSVYRNGVFHCGGALVNELWIVTAAHCVDKYSHYYYEIQAGVLRRYSYSPMVQNRIVSYIVAHQFYDRRKLKNDIALMKLSKPVEFNRYVRPICLPSEITAGKNFMWGPQPGTLCTAVGWGATVEHGSDPDHLREVNVPVHKKCKHREDEEGKEICAGLREGGKDACQGDSGGPFMCRNPNIPNQWYLAGIVSHGEGCARPNEPGVYTRVSLFLGWIFENIRAEVLSLRKPLRSCPGYVCKKSTKCIANKRRCDKIIDCLEGDDEMDCDKNSFPDIFKHAMRQMFLRTDTVNEEGIGNRTKSSNFSSTSIPQIAGATTTTIKDDVTSKATEKRTTGGNWTMSRSAVEENIQATSSEVTDLPSNLLSAPTPATIANDDTETTINTTEVTIPLSTISSIENTNETLPATKIFFANDTFSKMAHSTTITSITESTFTTNTEVPSTALIMSTQSTAKFDMPSWKFPNISSVSDKFMCKIILQTVDINKKCDRRADCEDATDELDCACVDYLKYKFPEAVCDGEINCLDRTDEENCSVCNENEYQCRQSMTCIRKSQKCDNTPDCSLHDDEVDCFALTNGKDILFDDDLHPHVNKSGVVSINHSGQWRVFCSDWTNTKARVAADICFYLGFNDYNNFMTVPLNNAALKGQYRTPQLHENVIKPEKCLGLYVKCSNKIDVKHYLHKDLIKPIRNLETPWNAEIYMDGVYKCTGTLLETDWVVTSSSCFGFGFQLYKHYVTILLGDSTAYLPVLTPHEQLHRVIDLIEVENTTIYLLRLEQSVNINRYVRPIGIDVKNYIVGETEICLAQGSSSKNKTNLVYFKPVQNCPSGFRCFQKDKHFLNCDKEQKHIVFWSGCIVCRSVHGWYPSAVYYERSDGCGFPEIVSYTSIQHWKSTILKLINQVRFIVKPPVCKGIRCGFGECIPMDKVCDGIENCRDGKDEDTSLCSKFTNSCLKTSNCTCLKSEIKCRNGKCVPKSTFCDKNNDCEDWSDEPDVCSCRAYLSLTNPQKICDGVRNCMDRTDEDPNICNCAFHSFACAKSSKCVSHDVVCDGVSDCPNGEDETQCISLISHPGSLLTEVQIRTAGKWHSGCFPKSPTTLQLEQICLQIGYTGNSAKKLIPDANTVRHSGHAITESFTGIWIRPNIESKFLIALRDGSEPFVKLKADENCYRLFLQCL